jgi:hypothetical protein
VTRVFFWGGFFWWLWWWVVCASFLFMGDGGQLKSFFDNLMRRQAREAGADRTMQFLDFFGQPSVGQDSITPQAFAMLNPEQQNQVLRRLREEGVDLGPYISAAGVEGTDVVDAANIAFNLPFDALSAVANLTNLERGREEGFRANIEGARAAFSESLNPDRFAAVEYAEEIGYPFPVALGTALDVAMPGPGALGFLPAPIMRALGKITGVVEDGKSVVPIGHGTTVEFDTPRPSSGGVHGSGLYVAPKRPDRDPNSDFNFYAQDEGGRVLPGFIGVPASRMLRPDNPDALLNNEQLQSFRQLVNKYLSPENTSREYYENLLDSEIVNHKEFFEFIYYYVPSNQMTNTIRNTGFDAMWDEGFEVGTIYNPEESFLPAYDNQRITDFIESNRDVLTDDEYREAMASLKELGTPLEFASSMEIVPANMAAASTALEKIGSTASEVPERLFVSTTIENIVNKYVDDAVQRMGPPTFDVGAGGMSNYDMRVGELDFQRDELIKFLRENQQELLNAVPNEYRMYSLLNPIAPDLIVETEDGLNVLMNLLDARPSGGMEYASRAIENVSNTPRPVVHAWSHDW